MKKHLLLILAVAVGLCAGAQNVRVLPAENLYMEKGQLHRGVIFCELVRRGYKVDVGVVGIEHVVDGGRELRQHEIDFVVNTGFGKIYIQSAYGMNDPVQRERECLPLERTGDAFRRMVVTNGNERFWTDEKGISHVGLYPFLLDASILITVTNQHLSP